MKTSRDKRFFEARKAHKVTDSELLRACSVLGHLLTIAFYAVIDDDLKLASRTLTEAERLLNDLGDSVDHIMNCPSCRRSHKQKALEKVNEKLDEYGLKFRKVRLNLRERRMMENDPSRRRRRRR